MIIKHKTDTKDKNRINASRKATLKQNLKYFNQRFNTTLQSHVQ